MTFYEKSIIYKLKKNDDYDDVNIYIGSTTKFKNRKYQHKCSCNNENDTNHNYMVYQYIRENGGWNEWVMIPIEEYPCENKNQLKIRERYHIDLLRPTLNKQLPTRTEKEYWGDNKEKKQEIQKRYCENNKEKLNKYHKDYYETNKEKVEERNQVKIKCENCGCHIRKDYLNKHQKTNKCQNAKKD